MRELDECVLSLTFRVFLDCVLVNLMVFIRVLISFYLCFIGEDEKECKSKDLKLKDVASYKN